MAPLTDISRAFGGQQQQSSSEPISRTMQYRKITKPLLERQRRARINRCLDELKDILVTGLQAEGENVSRLEKADILELTVRHLQKLQQTQNRVEAEQLDLASRPIGDDEKFRSGFAKCAQEVSRALAQSPSIDIQVGTSLMVHLGHALNQISSVGGGMTGSSTSMSPISRTHRVIVPTPKSSMSPVSSECYTATYRPYTPPSSPEEYAQFYGNPSKSVWRPW